MLRTLRRAAPPCLLLLCLATDSPAPAQADPPATMRGFLRYQVRGLSAVQGGLLSGMTMSLATGVGMQAALLNTLRLVSGMAKVSGNPTTGQVETFMRTGKGFDFSGAPVSAGEGIDLDFVLESDGKGNWRLKSGNARYSGKTDAEFSHQNADGFVKITDRYSGEGSVRLTPENASITLTTTGKGKDRQVAFDVAVTFPVAATGKSRLSTNVYEIFFEDNGHVFKSGLNFLGQQHSDQTPSTPISRGMNYSRSGPLDSVLRGRETWQDLRDSGVMIEWELWPRCEAMMITPRIRDELVYDTLRPGRISRIARAEVKPSFLAEDLEWDFHPIVGSHLEFREIDALGPRPERSRGNVFEARYDTLPPRNSSFAYWDVSTRFVSEGARRAGCTDPAPRRVGYFFARDATNHGGPPGLLAKDAEPKGPTPNWFHYWMQTRASSGVKPSFVQYGGRGEGCDGSAYAYYDPGTRHIVMCDLAMPLLYFVGWNPLGESTPEGIDLFGSTILHEKEHHDNYWLWWSGGYSLAEDRDRDYIPDKIEKDVPVPAQVRTKRKCFDRTVQGPCFNPKLYDSFGYKMEDEHYLAWAANYRWPIGSADREDWSCPGKLSKGDCS